MASNSALPCSWPLDTACGVEAPAACSALSPEDEDLGFSTFVVLGLVEAFGLITEGVRLGGLLTSVLSCTLLAELAVGLIIRARKLSSGPLEALLGLLSVFLGTLDVDASDDRAAGFAEAAGARA